MQMISSSSHSKSLFLMFGLILLMSLSTLPAQATSPWLRDYAHRLIVLDGQLIMAASTMQTPFEEINIPGWTPDLYSRDAYGKWAYHNNQAIAATIDWGSSALPQSACQPEQPNICYQIDANDQFEAILARSENGGRTWLYEFTLPHNRAIFRERNLRNRETFYPADFQPRDLEFFPIDGEMPQPVVALGSAGLLARNEAGEWISIAVTPDQELAPDQAEWHQVGLLTRALGPELIAIGMVIWLLLSLQIMFVQIRRYRLLKYKWTLLVTPLLLILPLAVAIFVALPVYFVMPLLIPIEMTVFLAGICVGWLYLKRLGVVFAPRWLMLNGLSMTVSSAVIVLVPLYLWGLNMIANYETACTIALDLGVLFVAILIWQLWRISALRSNSASRAPTASKTKLVY